MLKLLLVLLAFLAPSARSEVVTATYPAPAIDGDGIVHLFVAPYTGSGTLTSVTLELLATVEVRASTENLAPHVTDADAVYRPFGTLRLFDGNTTPVATSTFALEVVHAGPWLPFDGGMDWAGPSARSNLTSFGLPPAQGQGSGRLSRYTRGLVPLTILADCGTTITAWGNVALWEGLTERCAVRVTYTAQ